MFPNNRKPHPPYDFSKGYKAAFCCSYSHCTVPDALLPVMASKDAASPTEWKKRAFVFEMES